MFETEDDNEDFEAKGFKVKFRRKCRIIYLSCCGR